MINPCHPWHPPPASTSTSTHCNTVRLPSRRRPVRHRRDHTSRLCGSDLPQAKDPPVYRSPRQSMAMPPLGAQDLTRRIPPLSRVLRSMLRSSDPLCGREEGSLPKQNGGGTGQTSMRSWTRSLRHRSIGGAYMMAMAAIILRDTWP